MNTVERKKLSIEAQMQLKALEKINVWKNIAISFSAIGVAAVYAGIAGTSRISFLSILGVIIIFLGAGSALVLNLGLKNGRRNVEKIIDALDKEK